MAKTKKIDPSILYKIIQEGEYDKKPVSGFVFVEDTITGADDEDGGADHDLIIKEVKTGKFYALSYTDWDMDNTDWDEDEEKVGERCDLPDEMTEVKPKKKTITVYE